MTMTTFRWMTLGAVLGFSTAMGVSCGPAKCTPANCAFGCCDASGSCQSGNSDSQCGGSGRACSSCVLGQSCQLGACVLTGTGAGGGSGGGTTGGGTGGGTTGGGTGGGTTGGGTGGGTTDALCTRLNSASIVFFAGNSSCSNGTVTISSNPNLLAQCNGGIAACTASADRTALTNYAACVEGAQACTSGNEDAAVSDSQSCLGTFFSTASQACLMGITTSGTGGGGGTTGGGTGGGTTGGGTGGGTTGGGTGGGTTGGGTGGGTTGGGGGSCDGCFFNGTCIIRANSNNNTVCGQGGVQCATCSGSQNCVNYTCTGAAGGGGGTTGGGGGTTGGGGGTTGGGGGTTGGGTGGGTTGGGGGSACTTLSGFTATRPTAQYSNTTGSYELTFAGGYRSTVDPSDQVNMEVIWANSAGTATNVTTGSRNLANEGTYAQCLFCAMLRRRLHRRAPDCTGGVFLGRSGTMTVTSRAAHGAAAPSAAASRTCASRSGTSPTTCP